jgi:hypothetical protein
MLTLELTALAIVILFIVVRAQFGERPRRFLWRLAILVVASWVVEDSVISAYHFYSYHPDWSLFVHHVPLAIVLIWPIVIHSGWELARSLLARRAGERGHMRRVVTLGGCLVLADAALIEPIAVSSKLWSWHEPGLFDVPPIGILGWAYYAAVCMIVFEWAEHRSAASRMEWIAIFVAPAVTHLALLGSWWGMFRWINQPLDPWPFVVVAWGLALGLAARSLMVGARRRVRLREILSRVPAAVFFFALLAMDDSATTALVAYALAFAPPYLSLLNVDSGSGATEGTTDGQVS